MYLHLSTIYTALMFISYEHARFTQMQFRCRKRDVRTDAEVIEAKIERVRYSQGFKEKHPCIFIQRANTNLFQSASRRFFMLYAYNKGFLHGIKQKYAAPSAPGGASSLCRSYAFNL